MNKGFTVYVSPLEMDSTAHRLVELPMEQEKLDALQLELNTGSPLYTEVSDFCGREYLEEHLPEDMDLTEFWTMQPLAERPEWRRAESSPPKAMWYSTPTWM